MRSGVRAVIVAGGRGHLIGLSASCAAAENAPIRIGDRNDRPGL